MQGQHTFRVEPGVFYVLAMPVSADAFNSDYSDEQIKRLLDMTRLTFDFALVDCPSPPDTEHNLVEYDELASKTASATARYSELSAQIKAAEKQLAKIAVLETQITNYAKTRDTYVAFRKAGYSKKFLSEHKSDILLHKAAKKSFDELGVKKLSPVKSLQTEYVAVLAKRKNSTPSTDKRVKKWRIIFPGWTVGSALPNGFILTRTVFWRSTAKAALVEHTMPNYKGGREFPGHLYFKCVAYYFALSRYSVCVLFSHIPI